MNQRPDPIVPHTLADLHAQIERAATLVGAASESPVASPVKSLLFDALAALVWAEQSLKCPFCGRFNADSAASPKLGKEASHDRQYDKPDQLPRCGR